MGIFDLITNLGALVGCLVGIAAAAVLHWAFPTHDLVVIQAVVIVLCTALGVVIEYRK